MYAVVKLPCIHGELAQYLEVITAEESSECIVKVTAEEWPEGNIETRGVNLTLLCAHNLPFDRRTPDKGPVESFIALYMTVERQLFSIEYDGKKAVLKVLDFDTAKKLYQELPQKLLPIDYLFNLETFQRNARLDKVNAESQRDAEVQVEKELEEYKRGSALYVKNGSSL